MLWPGLINCQPAKTTNIKTAKMICPVIFLTPASVCRRWHFKRGAHKLELRITERAHFGNVEALQFGCRAHALAHNDVDNPVEHVRQAEDDAHQGCAPYELGHKLAGIAVEQPPYVTVHAVPASAVVTRSVCEEAHRDNTPSTARSVNRDRTDRVVYP